MPRMTDEYVVVICLGLEEPHYEFASTYGQAQLIAQDVEETGLGSAEIHPAKDFTPPDD